ncbi:MAG: STY1053 family phage-associated protein [Ewingella sp.]|uniref:STY1053 family phage-associated protein n=1 Tax=Ewingella sp. TaxID=1897459 RepID=UPI003F922EA4
MKYLVSTPATLRFPDGSQVDLVPGINSFESHVAEHWAFRAHAKAVEDSDLEKMNSDADVSHKVSALEGEITELKAQVDAKDVEITELKAQMALLTNAPTGDDKNEVVQPGAEQETGNAKKQSSTNK